MKNQYLIMAENITYKYNKLSCINIYDQFMAFSLPAESFFDLVIMCGPGWEAGDYDVKIKVQINDEEEVELGSITAKIPQDNFVYNAIAPNLKILLPQNAERVSFHVYRNEERVLTRTYPVNTMFVPQQEQAAAQQG